MFRFFSRETAKCGFLTFRNFPQRSNGKQPTPHLITFFSQSCLPSFKMRSIWSTSSLLFSARDVRGVRFFSSNFDSFLDSQKQKNGPEDESFQNLTQEIETKETERNLLDNFFDEDDDMDLGDGRDIIHKMERLKRKQEEERGIHPQPQAKGKKALIQKSPSMEINDEGDLKVHGAEVPDKYAHYFGAAAPPNVSERREWKQEKAEKKLLAYTERAKMRKRKLYSRDVNDYPNTRRQLRISVEYYNHLCDALAYDNSLRELQKAGVSFEDVQISVSLKKATVTWSLTTSRPSNDQITRAKQKLRDYNSKLRYAVQERMDMKWAPLLDLVYSNQGLTEAERSQKTVLQIIEESKQHEEES